MSSSSIEYFESLQFDSYRCQIYFLDDEGYILKKGSTVPLKETQLPIHCPRKHEMESSEF